MDDQIEASERPKTELLEDVRHEIEIIDEQIAQLKYLKFFDTNKALSTLRIRQDVLTILSNYCARTGTPATRVGALALIEYLSREMENLKKEMEEME